MHAPHKAGIDTLTFGSIQFVATNGHKIDLHIIDIHWNLAHCLSCVGVKENLLWSAQGTCVARFAERGSRSFDTNIKVDKHKLIKSYVISHQMFAYIWIYLPMSCTGCLTPISLLTVIMDTRDVSGLMASSSCCKQSSKEKSTLWWHHNALKC